MNKPIKTIYAITICLYSVLSLSEPIYHINASNNQLALNDLSAPPLTPDTPTHSETISFYDYINLDNKNRSTTGNKIIILGADNKQYNLFNGEIITPIPLNIRNILLLMDEIFTTQQFYKLDFITKYTYPISISTPAIFQLNKPSPFTPKQNLFLITALNINIEPTHNLTVLDIYMALNGTPAYYDYGKQIYVYPHSDLHNKLVFRNNSNGYIIIHGSLSGNKLKPFSGKTSNSLNILTDLFIELVVFNSINEYDKYKATKDLKVIETDNCIILEGKCIEIY